MKRMLSLFLILASTVAFSHAQTDAERASALEYLEKTKQGVVDATKGLSAAQWNFKSAPDRWSVAEVAEHIAAAEDFLYGKAEEDMKSPARPAGEDVKAIDDFILTGVPDRSHKAQAPEPLKPTNRFGSPEGSLKHFAESRAKTEAFIKDGKGLRDHAAPGPMDKKFDPYEWVLFLTAHSERHTKQILEVKADPNFPKS